jgi:type II secretory pathway predicted ATPase ExeA
MTVPKTQADPRSHFGFTGIPFTREIAVPDRWPWPPFDEALQDLVRTIDQRQSAVLIAPAGAGKTAVLRATVAQLAEARYRVHYVKVTSIGKRDLCREIAVACGLPPTGTYPGLVRRLQERFETCHSGDGLRPVLILDEAHDLRPDVLGMLRILTNFDMDSRLVLSMVLAGQPSLLTLLRRDDLDAVSRRMGHLASLRLLSRDEARQYMQHRIRIAGGREFPFDDQATEAVFELTRGNLRAIDHLCRKSLEWAALSGHPAVDAAIVTAARARLLP